MLVLILQYFEEIIWDICPGNPSDVPDRFSVFKMIGRDNTNSSLFIHLQVVQSTKHVWILLLQTQPYNVVLLMNQND